jgi:hypothetical protein
VAIRWPRFGSSLVGVGDGDTSSGTKLDSTDTTELYTSSTVASSFPLGRVITGTKTTLVNRRRQVL